MPAAAVGALGSLLLPGGSALSLGLYYLSGACFLLIWACVWRRPLSFLRLALASIVAFPVSVFLHNALYALAEVLNDYPILSWTVEAFHVGFFLIAVILSPTGVVVGILGLVALWLYGDRKH